MKDNKDEEKTLFQAIDAVDDAGIIVVHALVHRTEAGVTQ